MSFLDRQIRYTTFFIVIPRIMQLYTNRKLGGKKLNKHVPVFVIPASLMEANTGQTTKHEYAKVTGKFWQQQLVKFYSFGQPRIVFPIYSYTRL